MVTKAVMLIGILYDNQERLFRPSELVLMLKLNSHKCVEQLVSRLRRAGAKIETVRDSSGWYYTFGGDNA